MKTEQKEDKKVYPFTIDGKPHKSNEQYITGAEIRKLGTISPDYEIFLKVPGHGDDVLIKDGDKVDLGKPGAEHFYSCKPNTNNG